MKHTNQSHTGSIRSSNEDSVLCEPDHGLFVVADGIGGHAHGAQASRIAVETIAVEVRAALRSVSGPEEREEVLKNAFHAANAKVLELSTGWDRSSTAGTTATAVWLTEDRLIMCHAGDSRLYLLQGDLLVQLSRDQTFIQEMIDMGRISPEDARESPYANVLSMFLGNPKSFQPQVASRGLDGVQCLMLCTDGLTKVFTDEELSGYMNRAGTEGLEDLSREMLHAGLDRGAPDNLSFILVVP